MTRMGIEAVSRKPPSQRHPAHPVSPYLLRNVEITRSNHVRAADITYLPMHRGFVCLCAVMDWASCRVLAWRLANTMTINFWTEAVQESMTNDGAPIKDTSSRAWRSRGSSKRTALRSAWTHRLLARQRAC